MNIPFYIARRYLFAKKSTHAINIISCISVLGVAVATMALVVMLSVFNGFHDLVASFFTTFDPQLKVAPAMGKASRADDPVLQEIRRLPEVAVATDVVEDMALAMYNGRQAMAIVKGVEDNFDSLTRIRDVLVGEGDFELHAAELCYGIPGIGLASTLGTGYYYPEPVKMFAPRREGQLDGLDMENNFVEDELYSPGVLFNMKQAKYDRNYMLTGIAFARHLFDRDGMVTSVELRLHDGADEAAAKKKIRSLAGDKYTVLDRYEQQADTFRIMKVEKLIGYIFLTFILVVACFNIVGSLSMLMIDKKSDVATLRSLGADDSLISKIFLFEGRMISVAGAVAGVAGGLFLCWLQQTCGIIALGRSSGMFVVDAYPVSVHPADIVVVFLTVLAVGSLAVWYPVRYFSQRILVSERAPSEELAEE